MTTIRQHRNHWFVTVVRVGVGIGAVVVGLGVVLITIALGHCSAFGGTCPGDSGLDSEVFFSAAAGAALAIGVPLFAYRPIRKQALIAVMWAMSVGALVGAAAAGANHG